MINFNFRLQLLSFSTMKSHFQCTKFPAQTLYPKTQARTFRQITRKIGDVIRWFTPPNTNSHTGRGPPTLGAVMNFANRRPQYRDSMGQVRANRERTLWRRFWLMCRERAVGPKHNRGFLASGSLRSCMFFLSSFPCYIPCILEANRRHKHHWTFNSPRGNLLPTLLHASWTDFAFFYN